MFGVLAVACGDDEPDATLTATATAPASATAAPPSPTPAASPTPVPTAEPEVPPPPTPTVPSPPPPGPDNPSPDFVQLQADLERTIAEYWVSGSYAFAVTDLQTGETAHVRGDVRHMSGCVMNLFVIYQAVLDVEAGRYELDKVDSLIRSTTWSSNAATAWELYKIAGDGDATEGTRRVGEMVRDVLGLEQALLDHPPGYFADSLDLDYNNWVTALEMNRALAQLWNRELVSDESRAYLLEVLSEVSAGLNYLTAAVPEGRVSHKNGFFVGDTGWVDNDVGIVQLQRGDEVYAYAVSFFSEEVPTEFGDIVLGQQLVTLAYEVMAARYPAEATD